jgi:hypothetical protein
MPGVVLEHAFAIAPVKSARANRRTRLITCES